MINQVTLVGRITKDPELKWTPDGKAVTNITLAVNRHYKNPNGEIDADFVHCTLWGKTAENTSNYCRKGSVIGVTGRIQTRNYENQEGKRVYVTEVVAEGVRFLSSKPVKENTQHKVESFAPPMEREREELPF
ncbi:single-stranded DNA-binding protein [Bacillus sp. JJ1122]|uniref:single-stranded DNA-binding protein n=1 Tax=Bacillus sp. JJ1122 TaxID=3122951 RepID=UPI002FFEB994